MIVEIKYFRWEASGHDTAFSTRSAAVLASIGHDVRQVQVARPIAIPFGRSGAYNIELRVWQRWEMLPDLTWRREALPPWTPQWNPQWLS